MTPSGIEPATLKEGRVKNNW